ncbi:SEC12-like protein 2 [Hordeum vulgare]|nr:SEC12-like protein 2 [Hordeum vulgare]
MDTISSSSSGSRSRSSKSPTLLPVKPESLETLIGRRTCSGALIIKESNVSSPTHSSSRLDKPKTKPAFLPVKQEHLAMDDDDETALK